MTITADPELIICWSSWLKILEAKRDSFQLRYPATAAIIIIIIIIIIATTTTTTSIIIVRCSFFFDLFFYFSHEARQSVEISIVQNK